MVENAGLHLFGQGSSRTKVDFDLKWIEEQRPGRNPELPDTPISEPFFTVEGPEDGRE